MVKHSIARVEMHGQLVGALAYDEKTNLCAFEFDPDWLKAGVEISPIHMPLAKTIYQFPALPKETYKGLPGVFSDTLPDDFGNAIIDAWLTRSGRDKNSFTALERLLYTGARGMGALEYLPAINGVSNKSTKIELNELVDVIQSIVDQRSNLAQSIEDHNRKDAMAAILQVGTSAGGARPKAVIGINHDRTEIRSGQVALPDGFEHYLLKFDGVVEHSKSKQTFGDPQGYGRMEYAYYLMAKDAGINMSHCELLEDGNLAHFMTKRFDRHGNKKIHYQSLCAMDHADYKQPGQYSYEQLFALMRTLRLSRKDALEMYRRMIFNIIARNHDDHTKNIGFILNENHKWELSPAFDIAYSYLPGSAWVNAHQLSLNGKRDHFNRNDLLVVADTFISEANFIINEVIDAVSRWSEFSKTVGVFPDFAATIQSNHRLHIK